MVLGDIAAALENLVADVIAMMNEGATLDTIVHTVSVPAETLAKPYLRPLYDEPEFVIRNIWRQFGGWWDGAASRLKPSPDGQLAAVIADLCGGPHSPRCVAPSKRSSTTTCGWPATSPISPAGQHRRIPLSTPVGRRSTSNGATPSGG